MTTEVKYLDVGEASSHTTDDLTTARRGRNYPTVGNAYRQLNNRDTPCNICGELFKGLRGVAIHQSSKHQFNKSSQPSGENTINSKSSTISQMEDHHIVLARLRQTTKIMKRIPKGARCAVAQDFTEVVNLVLNSNDIESWGKLSTFSYGALGLPTSNKESRKVSLATLVKRNLSAMRNGAPHNLDEAVRVNSLRITPSKCAELKLADGDVRGAVRILCADDSVAPITDETLQGLRDKHPDAQSAPDYPDPPVLMDNVWTPTHPNEVLKAVHSFATGSSGGMDGLRPQHLKDLLCSTNGDAATKLAEALGKLIDLMFSGTIPDAVCKFLYGAALTALKKKDGGIRPIAVGNTLRRLAAKIGCNRVREELGSSLKPFQLGFGVSGGAEACVHAAERFIQHEHHSPQIFLKLDFKNAFNTVHRDCVLKSAKEHIPSLYSFIWQCYRNETYLSFGQDVILSQSGVQQGDPLGPLLFCLALKPLVENLESPFNVWYLDDGAIGGDVPTILQDIKRVSDFSESSGLALNPSKCEVFLQCVSPEENLPILNQLRHLLPGCSIVPKDKLCLLGSPLTTEAVPSVLDAKTEEANRMCSRVLDIDAHSALFLLKNCMAIPKLVYTLRTCPAWKFNDKLRALDDVFRNCLERITNTEIDLHRWRQASLPVSRGGLGIRSVEELALPAFLASSFATEFLVSEILRLNNHTENVRAVEALEMYLCLPGSMLPSPETRACQKAWDEPLAKWHLDQLLKSEDPKTRARLLAVSCRESGKWLEVLPSPSLGTLLNPDALRIAVALRLGAPMCEPHICVCGTQVDSDGQHGLCCRRSAGRHPRHHALNDNIKRALVSAGCPSILEPVGMSRQDGKRPDGATLVPWMRGKTLVWDATCVDTLATTHLTSTCVRARAAASGAEDRKIEKYRCLGDRYIFCPLGFETLGGFGPSATQLVEEIGQRITERTGEKRATLFLKQRLSVEIQRGNAISILSTIPSGKSLDEVFYLL